MLSTSVADHTALHNCLLYRCLVSFEQPCCWPAACHTGACLASFEQACCWPAAGRTGALLRLNRHAAGQLLAIQVPCFVWTGMLLASCWLYRCLASFEQPCCRPAACRIGALLRLNRHVAGQLLAIGVSCFIWTGMLLANCLPYRCLVLFEQACCWPTRQIWTSGEWSVPRKARSWPCPKDWSTLSAALWVLSARVAAFTDSTVWLVLTVAIFLTWIDRNVCVFWKGGGGGGGRGVLKVYSLGFVCRCGFSFGGGGG